MKRRLLAIIFLVIFILTSCKPNVQSENLMKDVHENVVDCDPTVAVNGADVCDFAIRLLQATKTDKENILLSPMSILCALGMTANGAKEETLSQMEDVMGVPVNMLNNYIYGYRKVLPQSEKCKLNLANSIWFVDDKNLSVEPTFLQLNADYYGADMYRTPFNQSTVNDINRWVKNETAGMIPEILNNIPQNTVMYLINALAFEGEWAEKYEKKQVREGVFTTQEKDRQTVEFMYSTEDYYMEDEHAKGFVKFYKDSNYAFVALLPNEDTSVSEYIKFLDGTHLDELISKRQSDTVRVSIPKFEAQYSVEMSKILSDMGMPNAFHEDKANFRGLGTFHDGNIFMNRVIHKTYISVEENGTKAGAVTLIEMNSKGTAAMQEEKVVYLNRPFIYMLVDCDTNMPFFVGTMMNVN